MVFKIFFLVWPSRLSCAVNIFLVCELLIPTSSSTLTFSDISELCGTHLP